MMKLSIRAVGFAALAAGVWAVDAGYRDVVLTPAEGSAAIGQVNGKGAVTLATLHRQGNLADDAAIGATALAAIGCFGTWRPTPRTVFINHRTQE